MTEGLDAAPDHRTELPAPILWPLWARGSPSCWLSSALGIVEVNVAGLYWYFYWYFAIASGSCHSPFSIWTHSASEVSMPIPPDTVLNDPATKRAMTLWLASAVGPLTWFLLLLAVYWRSGEKCAPIARAWLCVWVALSCSVTLASGRYARCTLKHQQNPRSAASDRSTRFVAWSGWILSIYCVLISLSFLAPILAWTPCE